MRCISAPLERNANKKGALPQGEAAPLDFQRPYLEAILRFIGITDVRTLVIEPTLLAGPRAADEALRRVIDQARSLAAGLA